MIKNDAWIAAAAQGGLISPFEPKLVRRVEMGDLGHTRPVIWGKNIPNEERGKDCRFDAIL